jgi:hypothetical protein
MTRRKWAIINGENGRSRSFPVPNCDARQLFVLRQLAVEQPEQDKQQINKDKQVSTNRKRQGTSAKNPKLLSQVPGTGVREEKQ